MNPADACLPLIEDFLIRNCHSATLESLIEGKLLSTLPEEQINSMNSRRQIINSINSGQIQDAIKLISTFNPKFSIQYPQLNFRLYSQVFIELIAIGDVHEALRFAQEQLVSLARENQQMMQVLQVI